MAGLIRIGMTCALLVLAVAAPGSGQRLDLWLDASGAHALPPAAAARRDASTYALLGGRARLLAPGGLGLDASAYGGKVLDGAAGNWWSGSAATSVVRTRRIGTASAALEGFGSEFGDHSVDGKVSRYRSYGAALRPRLALRAGPVSLEGRLEWLRGRMESMIDTRPPLSPLPVGNPAVPGAGSRRTGLPTALVGWALEACWAAGAMGLSAGVDRQRASRGAEGARFHGVSGGVTAGVAGLDLAATVRAQRDRSGAESPTEFGYQIAMGAAVGSGAYASLSFGRATTDPLYGTPGHTTFGAGLSIRLAGVGGGRARRSPVVELGDRRAGGRLVRFRLQAPQAARAAVAGDFSEWRPLVMQRRGDTWELETVLPPGLHHFSFILDDEQWTVPDDAPGLVDDGWGRRNATLLIEG